MRPAASLLAAIKPAGGAAPAAAARYLEPGAPTGLTGLRAHASPRAMLLFLYRATLARLQAAVPAASVYRQSVEAVTRQRLAAVAAVAPAGWDAWRARAAARLAAHPAHFRGAHRDVGGQAFVVRPPPAAAAADERYLEWDGDGEPPLLANLRVVRQEITEEQGKALVQDGLVEWEDEPQLTLDQIEELENKIGAGLIEEVIQVAEGELKLVDTMIQAKVWESLDEKPPEGQWTYFERKA